MKEGMRRTVLGLRLQYQYRPWKTVLIGWKMSNSTTISEEMQALQYKYTKPNVD